MKKLKYFLQKWDGIWSVPLSFALYAFIGYFLSNLGLAVGTFDLGFIQPLFLAACVVIFATNMAVAGVYFTFRGVHNYIYGNRDSRTGKFIKSSQYDWRNIAPEKRIYLGFGLIIYYITATILVYCQFV